MADSELLTSLQSSQVWKNELDSIRAEWQEDVEDKEKKIKLLQTAMQVQNIMILFGFQDCLILFLKLS